MAAHELNEELLRRRQEARQGGGSQAIERQHAKGKLTARERLDHLMDPGSFQEIDPYVTHRHSDFGLDKKRFPGDSVVTGLGRINGQKVAVAAQEVLARLLDAHLRHHVAVVVGARLAGEQVGDGQRRPGRAARPRRRCDRCRDAGAGRAGARAASLR